MVETGGELVSPQRGAGLLEEGAHALELAPLHRQHCALTASHCWAANVVSSRVRSAKP